MSNDLISIILCTKNNVIDPLVYDSINKQTYHPIELIIECGSDNNNAVRNRGFAKSTGKYIFFMDEDIILHTNCIEMLHNQLTRCQVDFSYCNYDRQGALSGIQSGKIFDYESLKKMNYISTMSLMKRKIFTKFDIKIKRLQDWDLFLDICAKGYTGTWVDEVLFLALYRDGDISTKGGEHWTNSVEIIKKKHNIQ